MWHNLNILWTILWACGASLGLAATIVGPIPWQPTHVRKLEEQNRDSAARTRSDRSKESETPRLNSSPTPASAENQSRPDPESDLGSRHSAPAGTPDPVATAPAPLSEGSFEALRERIDQLDRQQRAAAQDGRR